MRFERLYYAFKPYFPWTLRMSFRRWFAERARQRFRDVWPILPAASRPPADWPGWPEGRQFAFILTHDVEGRKGLENCRKLMAVEEEMGFRSCFNFIPEGDSYQVPAEFRHELVTRGFEVGVHDLRHDGSLFRNYRTFSRQAVRINAHLRDWDAAGFRAGFMRHNLDWQHALDIQYDASTFDTDPFEPQPDGVQTIFPFWVPGRTESKASSGRPSMRRGYVELPYTLPQDSTLFLLFRESTPAIWRRKLDWIVEHGGMALVNVHPDYIAFNGHPVTGEFPVRLYRGFLDHVRTCYDGRYWHALPREVAAWFKRECVDARAVSVAGKACAQRPADGGGDCLLSGKRAASVVFSYFPSDPRPRREALSLVNSGMTVDYFCLRDGPGTPARETSDGIQVTRLPITRQRSHWIRYMVQYAGFFITVSVLLSWRSLRRHYDLIHVHNMPDFLVFAALIPKWLGARVVLDLHDPMPEVFVSIFKSGEKHPFVRLLKLQERLSIAFADLAITPNIAFKERFVARGCPPDKMNIVMNSPQEEIFGPMPEPPHPARQPGQPFRVMYHGSLVGRHGLDTAVEAVSMLRQWLPDVVFDIYGAHTPYVDEVLAAAKGDGIRYHGLKSQAEIAALIVRSDLGIIPNRRTVFTEINMPTRVFEFLACGRPVICPDTRGIRDYFDDSSMIFFEPSSSKDLARCIKWVYENPAATREKVVNGQQVYARHRWKDEEQVFKQLMVGLLRS